MKPVLGTPASIASSADFSCISELLESVVIFFLCPISLSIYTSREIYTIPGCYKDVYINSFFACAGKLWNSFSEECFPLIYDLNGFKSRVNKHLLFVCSFWSAFQYDFHLCFFFLVTPCLVGVAQLCMKKNWTERERHNKIIIQSNNFISVHFSVDTGKYLFTKIYVLVNEMKCFLFLGGIMFKIFWGSQIPVTTGGFCTGSGVIKIEVREVFLYYYIFILLFQGSVMVVHMLTLYSWYLSSVKIPPFLGAINHNRDELNHS